MVLPIIKFLHLLCGTSFFGIIIAEFFYIVASLKTQDRSLIQYSIKASYCGDALILMCVLIQLATSTALVVAGKFTLSVPWILVAYHAFALLILLWLTSLALKKWKISKEPLSKSSIKIFYIVNIAMIVLFIIVIHDAIMQQTVLEFLFRR